MDFVKVFVTAGNGGDGCLSFRREKYIPFGGPDGGDGGKGGDIYCQSDSNLNTLLEVSHHPHWKGGDGGNGKGKNLFGRAGKDSIIYVPCGTVIKDGDRIIADMAQNGHKILLAKGGRGGRGNASFKSHSNTAPQISEKGEPGEKRTFVFELKVLADVGLVGFPNAGKSTLLSRISSARPRIAAYPFTTLSPNLGTVYHKKKSFVAADIPGLIEGAHEGRGLGTAFLKHIQRTRVLVHLVDPAGFLRINPIESIKTIAAELKKFDACLAGKPRLIAVNKSDLPGAEDVFKKTKKHFRKHKIFLISAATGSGVSVLLDEIIKILSKTVKIEDSVLPGEAESVNIARMEPAFSVSRDSDGVIRISGNALQSMLAMTHFNQPEAIERLKRNFKRMGVDKALKKSGISECDTVRVGEVEFEWFEEVQSFKNKFFRRKK